MDNNGNQNLEGSFFKISLAQTVSNGNPLCWANWKGSSIWEPCWLVFGWPIQPHLLGWCHLWRRVWQTNKQTNKQTFTHIYIYIRIYAICVYYCEFKKSIDVLIEPATNTPSLAMLCFCSTFFHIYKAMDLTPHVGSFPSPPPLHQGQVSPFIHTPWFGSARFKKPKHPWYVAFFFTCNHSIQLSAISFLDYCKHEIELMWGPYKHVRKLEKQLLFVYAYICI